MKSINIIPVTMWFLLSSPEYISKNSLAANTLLKYVYGKNCWREIFLVRNYADGNLSVLVVPINLQSYSKTYNLTTQIFTNVNSNFYKGFLSFANKQFINANYFSTCARQYSTYAIKNKNWLVQINIPVRKLKFPLIPFDFTIMKINIPMV